jgi:Ca-activated chloride channel family protein
MRLLRPDMAAWLLVVPVVVAAWAVRSAYRWKHRTMWPLRGAAQRRTGWVREVATVFLAAASVFLLAAALTRPQVRAELSTPVFEKQDLVLILDRSVSMRARDIQPSRFARAVDEIQRFLERKPPTLDRIALVGFAGTSVVLSYPTSDLDSLFFYLDWVRDDPSALYGTDMSSALETALSLAQREGTPRIPPIFVLVSDGEDHGAGLEGTTASVSRAGIRLYTIGIGSAESVTIPVLNDRGREELLRDDSGQVMRTRFEEGTLRRLASMTGGQYFRSVSGVELERALNDIVEDERRQTGSVSRIEYRDIYPLLLAAAAASLIGLVSLW